MNFKYRGARVLQWTALLLMIASFPAWLLLDGWYSVLLSGLSMSCWSEYHRLAARHYRRALEYVVSGEITRALREQNPSLLELKSDVVQGAMNDLTH